MGSGSLTEAALCGWNVPFVPLTVFSHQEPDWSGGQEQEALPTGHPCVRGPGLGAAGLSCEFSYQNPKHASGYLLFPCPLPRKGSHKASPGLDLKV